MTERNLTAGVAAEVAAAKLFPVIFFEGAFYVVGSPSSTTEYVRVWSGIGTMSWNGHDWLGAGNLLSISALNESAAIESIGFTVVLSGQPSAMIALALSSVRHNLHGKIWLGMLDEAGALIPDPYPAMQGRLADVAIQDNGNTCTIACQYESRLIDLFNPRIRRYTDGDQKIDYPDDDGFRQVAALQDLTLMWGGPGAPTQDPGGEGPPDHENE
jgi:hypothetical protein